MNSNLPPGVTMSDIDGPPMPRCFVCGGEHNDDDRNGICPDCHDVAAGDISNFNAAVADFDALTNYRFDRVDPYDIALWMRESWGERNTFYITFCLLAKRLGYEL